MKTFIGIDLGSTTTKAVMMDENAEVLGRGITNSRSNYETAAAVAKQEATVAARLFLFRRALGGDGSGKLDDLMGDLERNFRLEQFLDLLQDLQDTCIGFVTPERFKDAEEKARVALKDVFARLNEEAPGMFSRDASRKSDFFRDIAGSRFMQIGEEVAQKNGLSFDLLLNVYDKSIIEVESRPPDGDMAGTFQRALGRVLKETPDQSVDTDAATKAMDEALAIDLEETFVVGTGYGRVTLPFPKEHIRSEILCHGLGAHMMFPDTRTVLDIGGQDTKAIQVDDAGIVENFQMNDRCAAGCGRYLARIRFNPGRILRQRRSSRIRWA